VTSSDTEIVIIGGGAAGIAAARRLKDADAECLVVEARPRLGGRAWTNSDNPTMPTDLGCGWLHSADRNPWREIAEAQGRSIDKTPPPLRRPSVPIGFPLSEQSAFLQALEKFYERFNAFGKDEGPAATFLESGGRWNEFASEVSRWMIGGRQSI
jgi:monoamine oxidase